MRLPWKFLHSADWQLGCRFAQFGAKAGVLRDARLKTLRRTLEMANQRNVDAFIIAGDLFDDSQVDEAVVTAALEVFASFPQVRIFILPGNHDPFIGPGSVETSFQESSPSIEPVPPLLPIKNVEEPVSLRGDNSSARRGR